MLKKKWIRGAIYAIDKEKKKTKEYTMGQHTQFKKSVWWTTTKGGKMYVQYEMCWELI